jgi:hypothetical protein
MSGTTASTAVAPVLFETSTDGLQARAVAGRGSRVLAVVFSQVRVPSGHLGLSRLFARTRHACLFLNQPSGRWYRGAAKLIDSAITQALELADPSRLVFYGSSMGGFGAIATAARWPAAEVIAFAPDYRIGEPGSRSREAGLDPSPVEPDLASLLASPRTGAVDIVIGLFDPYDAGVAAQLAGLTSPTVRVRTAASGHEVHDHLYTVNVIRRIITGFDRDIAGALADRGLLHPPVDPATLSSFATLSLEIADGRPIDPGHVRALGLEGNPGAAMLEAAALDAAGDPVAADAVLAALARTVAASPALSSLPKRYLKQIPLRRLALLSRSGRTSEAEAVRAAAEMAFPRELAFQRRPEGL